MIRRIVTTVDDDGSRAGCPFQPSDEKFHAELPQRIEAQRSRAPVEYLPKYDLWVVCDPDEILSVLLDAESYSSSGISHPRVGSLDESVRLVLTDPDVEPGRTVSGTDSELHHELRGRLKSSLVGRMGHLEAAATAVAREAADVLRENGSGDLVQDFAGPVSATVLVDLIGFPASDAAAIRRWGEERVSLTWGMLAPARQMEAVKGLVSYRQYISRFVEERVRAPAEDDLTSDLLDVAGGAPGDAVIELTKSIVSSVSFAGVVTTARLISSLLSHLLAEDRSLWEALSLDSTLIPRVVEETLRVEPPLYAWQRVASRQSEICGVTIPAGARLLLVLAAIGLDPVRQPEPQAFDPQRAGRIRHAAFGHGIHYCPGAGIARMEARVAVEAIMRLGPHLRLRDTGSPARTPNLAFRGPSQLTVDWSA